MRALPDAELNKLKASQRESMQDLCHIQRVTYVSGTYGNNVEQLAYLVSGTTCSFQFMLGTMREANQVLLVDYDVMMRIPSTIGIRLDDKVTLIEKGNTMVSGTFSPHTQPIVNEMVQYVMLKRVAT
jgi:hypothetical protein